ASAPGEQDWRRSPEVTADDPAEAQPRRSRRWRPLRLIALGVLALLAPVGWSYGHALTARGTDSWSVRSVEWLREHGGGGVVNSVERWWYLHHQPPKGGAPAAV